MISILFYFSQAKTEAALKVFQIINRDNMILIPYYNQCIHLLILPLAPFLSECAHIYVIEIYREHKALPFLNNFRLFVSAQILQWHLIFSVQ